MRGEEKSRHRVDIYIRYVWAALAIIALTACGGKKRIDTEITSKPYEALVVGDTLHLVEHALEKPVDCLPQAEPSFDVTTCRPRDYKGLMRGYRNVVRLKWDPAAEMTSISVDVEAYEKGLMRLCITASSLDALRRDLPQIAPRLLQMLNGNEKRQAVKRLKDRHNPAMEQRVSKMMGITMLIPADMRWSKTGKDFIWLSNNAAEGMQNICIYRGTNRDSTMQRNIKGETDRMWMQTVKGSVRQYPGGWKRGLWQMKGDAMGGPFVSRSVTDSHGRTLTVEAFVFAPATTKRNKLKATEAALTTARIEAQK